MRRLKSITSTIRSAWNAVMTRCSSSGKVSYGPRKSLDNVFDSIKDHPSLARMDARRTCSNQPVPSVEAIFPKPTRPSGGGDEDSPFSAALKRFADQPGHDATLTNRHHGHDAIPFDTTTLTKTLHGGKITDDTSSPIAASNAYAQLAGRSDLGASARVGTLDPDPEPSDGSQLTGSFTAIQPELAVA